MPSLFRFLIALVVLAVLGAAAMVYLAVFVGPHTREMTASVPAAKLQQQSGAPQVPAAQPLAPVPQPQGQAPSAQQ